MIGYETEQRRPSEEHNESRLTQCGDVDRCRAIRPSTALSCGSVNGRFRLRAFREPGRFKVLLAQPAVINRWTR